MSICRKCEVEKEIDKFTRDSRLKSGYSTICKECENKRNRDRYDPKKQHEKFVRYKNSGYYKTDEFREKNKVKCRKYAHENPEKFSKYSLKWAEKNRDKKREYQEKWRKANLKQVAAGRYLQVHVKKGNIIRPNKCSECLKECRAEAHHEYYTKPLEVQWYCRRCHMKKHRKNLE